MAELKVEVVQIESVTPHPNADKLDLITLSGMGYQVITGKGNLEVGDLAFYFPIDSVIPDVWVTEFNIGAYYSKKLRATKLRGIFSEGLLIKVGIQHRLFNSVVSVGDDYTEYFGVTKYVPQYSRGTRGGGNHSGHVGEQRFPSPEHIKKYKDVFVDGEEVIITEKLHGMNFFVSKELDGNIKVASHNFFWEDTEVNQKVPQIQLVKQYPELTQCPSGVIIYGELYGAGIQDLTYGESGINYAIFAVSKDGVFLDYEYFNQFCQVYRLKTVPELYSGAYSYERLLDFNNMNSVICETQMAEGICIVPIKERTSPKFGRVCMKYVFDRYLLRKNGSEEK